MSAISSARSPAVSVASTTKTAPWHVAGRSWTGSTYDFSAVSYNPGATGPLRWFGVAPSVPANQQFITDNGTASSTDYAGAIRVTYEGGPVDHDGNIFLYGSTTAAGSILKFGIVKFVQTDCPTCSP